MPSEEVNAILADLKARMLFVEAEIKTIKEDQSKASEKAQEAALREKDMMAQMEELSRDIKEHVKMHEQEANKKVRAIDVILGIGMLITAGMSAYGSMALVAITKASGH